MFDQILVFVFFLQSLGKLWKISFVLVLRLPSSAVVVAVASVAAAVAVAAVFVAMVDVFFFFHVIVAYNDFFDSVTLTAPQLLCHSSAAV